MPVFQCRTGELAWLRNQWATGTARVPSTGCSLGGPRTAVIVAESGIGKGRLVQALYHSSESAGRAHSHHLPESADASQTKWVRYC